MWAPGWAKGLVGRSFILEGFYAEKKYAGQVLHATALSGDLMPKEVVTPALRDLVGVRLGISAKELKASALTGHALRHYLTEVAVAGGWPDPMVDPLGRWASRANHVALKRSAAASYSAGVTSLDREFALRVRAIGLVRDFVGNGDWEQKLPTQRDGQKSFSFLFEGGNGDSVVEEVEEERKDGKVIGPRPQVRAPEASVREPKRLRRN